MSIFGFLKKNANANQTNKVEANTPEKPKVTTPVMGAEQQQVRPHQAFCTVEIKNSNAPSIPTNLPDGYAKTIFLNAYSKPTSIPPESGYFSYIRYECGITNPQAFHRQLVENGDLAECPLNQKLSALKVDELKTILTSRGFPATGKKVALISSIEENVDCSTLNLKKTYSITEQGQKFIDDHIEFVLFHKNKNNYAFTLEQYLAAKKPGYKYNDVMWALLNEEVIKSPGNGSAYWGMYRILLEEGKSKDALQMILRAFNLDISGMEGATYFHDSFWTAKEVREGFDSSVFVAPGKVNAIAELKDHFVPEMIDNIYAVNLPIQLCSKELFAKTIDSIFKGTFDEAGLLKKLKTEYNRRTKGTGNASVD